MEMETRSTGVPGHKRKKNFKNRKLKNSKTEKLRVVETKEIV